MIGLSAMEVVPKHLVGGAHGLACAVAQGEEQKGNRGVIN